MFAYCQIYSTQSQKNQKSTQCFADLCQGRSLPPYGMSEMALDLPMTKNPFKKLMDPDAVPDHHQNLNTSSLDQVQPTLKFSANSASNFLHNLSDKQMNSLSE